MGLAHSSSVSWLSITNDYELAIKLSKELEYILEAEFSASGRGLHEKVTSARDLDQPLSEMLQRDIRYLATIRNRLIHERGFDHIPDRQEFLRRFEASSAELSALVLKRSQTSSTAYSCILA